MKRSTLYGYVYEFPVDFDGIDTADILDIHKYLMKKRDKKRIFRFIIKSIYWIIRRLHSSNKF